MEGVAVADEAPKVPKLFIFVFVGDVTLKMSETDDPIKITFVPSLILAEDNEFSSFNIPGDTHGIDRNTINYIIAYLCRAAS